MFTPGWMVCTKIVYISTVYKTELFKNKRVIETRYTDLLLVY